MYIYIYIHVVYTHTHTHTHTLSLSLSLSRAHARIFDRTHIYGAGSCGMAAGKGGRVGISRRPWRLKWTNRRADVRGDTENTAASLTQAAPWNEKSAYTLGPGFRLSNLQAFVERQAPGYRDGNWSVGTESTGGGVRSRHGNTSRYPALESRCTRVGVHVRFV